MGADRPTTLPSGDAPGAPAGRAPGRGFPEAAAAAHTEDHLREAVSVTARGDAVQLEVQLGHLCNNRCVFCVSGQLTQQRLARRIPEQPVVAALEAARARGVRRVTLLGGEPTLQRSFLPVLRRAVELGFDEVVIFTNGVRTGREAFVREVCALGRFTWRFSIQGGNEAAHDAVTGQKGSFAKILAGMRALNALGGQRITANACINELSYRSLPDYVDLVLEHGIEELHLDMIRPRSAGARSDEYLHFIQARYSDMAPYFADMLAGFQARRPGFDVHVGNLPFCVLPRWAGHVHHGGTATATVTTSDEGELARVHDKYDHQRDGMVHGARCGDCLFRPRCRGVPEPYLGWYGEDELVPLDEARVRALPPEARRAVREALEDRLEPPPSPAPGALRRAARLRRAGPLAGFEPRPSRATEDGRGVVLPYDGPEGRVDVVLRPRDGGTHLRFEAPSLPEPALRRFVLAVSRALRPGG